MRVLVAYASKYGATRGIAERMASTLRSEGLDADLQTAGAVGEIDGYDAFVIGSAAYMGRWLGEATRFVRRNLDALSRRPVWLFSSGPTGTATIDARGRDVLAASEPKEFAELEDVLKPRGRRVFYGALDGSKLRGLHRFFVLAPAVERAKIEGDFRDWALIEEWARSIAQQLSAAPHLPRAIV